jgi:hypothetical protein
MRWRFVLVALAACYKAGSEPVCGVSCASDRSCPGSLLCGDHNLCYDPSSGTCSTDATATGDAVQLDAAIDAPQGCFGHLGVVVCPNDATTTGLAPPTIDTGNAAMCSFVRNGLCVIAGTTFTISNNMSITGSRPLVIFASQELTINATATIDASSHIGRVNGPAANDAACTTSGLGGSDDGKVGGGGGAGGSFGTRGGSGGNGNGGSGVGMNAGTPGNAVMAMSLRGGCPGGTGGKSSSPGGSGGSGGGAIYLIALGTITFSGKIDVSGAGGGAGPASTSSGGGGGGSGGLVVFDAPSLTFNTGSLVLASGGGGGGSSRTTTATDGSDPTIGSPLNPAPGGKGNPPYGDGGAGSSTTSPGAGTDGAPVSADTGGGGGGGGAGHIVVFSSSPTFSGTTVPGVEVL